MFRFFLWSLLSLAASSSMAANLLLIIDDMGNNLALGERALALPQGVNYAFLPHTPQAVPLAHRAHALGQGILLHAPMENTHKLRLGPGGLYPTMDKQALQDSLHQSLAAIPHVQGINNHMGSLLTTETTHMNWVMEVAQQQQLFFVDSLTTAQSVAFQTAQKLGVPSVKRDVFLDNDLSAQALHFQFQRAIQRAKQQGYAVLIAHPYPETLAFLEKALPPLSKHKVQLTTLHDFFAHRAETALALQAHQQRTPALKRAGVLP